MPKLSNEVVAPDDKEEQGISNKRQVLLWLSEEADCLISISEKCCYRTFGFINKDTTTASVGS
jgi:hypothetical protein